MRRQKYFRKLKHMFRADSRKIRNDLYKVERESVLENLYSTYYVLSPSLSLVSGIE